MESLIEQSNKARHKGRLWRRIRNIIVITFLVVVTGGGWFYFYYPFAEGVKTGKLNFVVYKGVVFKTYEGKLIQSGIKSSAQGGIQSNEFIFSVSNKAVAERLSRAGGKTVELRYTEYFHAVPWRGFSKYVVNEILNIEDSKESGNSEIEMLEL
jgi:hypothetical protein